MGVLCLICRADINAKLDGLQSNKIIKKRKAYMDSRNVVNRFYSTPKGF